METNLGLFIECFAKNIIALWPLPYWTCLPLQLKPWFLSHPLNKGQQPVHGVCVISVLLGHTDRGHFSSMRSGPFPAAGSAPPGTAVQGRESRASHLGASHLGASQLDPSQLDSSNRDPSQLNPSHLGASHLGASQLDQSHLDTSNRGASHRVHHSWIHHSWIHHTWIITPGSITPGSSHLGPSHRVHHTWVYHSWIHHTWIHHTGYITPGSITPGSITCTRDTHLPAAIPAGLIARGSPRRGRHPGVSVRDRHPDTVNLRLPRALTRSGEPRSLPRSACGALRSANREAPTLGDYSRKQIKK